MSIERMNKQIKQYDELIRETMRKRDALIKQRDSALAAQTQRLFIKDHISPEELMKLKYVKAGELKKLIESIGKDEKKDEKEKGGDEKEDRP